MSKAFSELEKRIISSLLELDKTEGLNVLGNVISSYLPNNYYLEVTSETDACLMLKSEDVERVDLNLIESNLFELLITLFSLFEYLKSQRYIYFTGEYGSGYLGLVCADEQYVSCGFIDEELKKPLYEYTQGRFFITETFKQFVVNGYKTDSEIKRREELRYTRGALGITFIGLLASIFIPLFSTTAIDIKNDVIQTSSEHSTKQYIDKKLSENKVLIDAIVGDLEVLSNSFEQRTNSIQQLNANEIKTLRSSVQDLESQLKDLSDAIKVHGENAT